MLVAHDLSFGYRRGRDQLRNISLELGIGRTVLLGPNGAGKSTLLRVLAGALHPRGSVCLDGEPAPGARRSRKYRAAVGWLPQSIQPFPSLTAREHVAYAGWLKGMSRGSAWSEALPALETVGLGDRAAVRADRLSGGQVRRLGIASVLVHGARYLLLDEPTAGLDPRERDRLMEALDAVERSHAVLVSTHDTELLVAPGVHVVVLAQGEVRFTGSFDAFVGSIVAESVSDRVRLAYAALVPDC